MLLLAGFVLSFSGGCTYETLEDACPRSLKGSRDLSEDAEAFLHRINCYRRMAQVKPGRADAGITDALQNHVDYLEANYGDSPPDNISLGAETPGEEGFTGPDSYSRLEYVEKRLDPQYNLVLETYIFYGESDFPGLEERVDQLMADPYGRQYMLQPGYREGGYARSESWGNFIQVLPYPDNHDVGKPRFYPGDGQRDVPPNYVHPWYYYSETDPISYHEDIGYPITITVTDYYLPYEITMEAASLEGPDGEVEVWAFGPSLSSDVLLQTLVIAPKSPLEENSTYSVTATVSHSTKSFDLEWQFTTGEWNEDLTVEWYVF